MDGEDVRELSAVLDRIRYPSGLIAPIKPQILGRGYYPGFVGFENGTNPHGGIMFLNRDFGGLDYYLALLGEYRRTGMPVKETMHTWTQTENIYLPGVKDIPVWLTNYLMGARERELVEMIRGATGKKATRNVKTWISKSDWDQFESDCWEFLLEQVNRQRPRVVVVFGESNKEDLFREERFGQKRKAKEGFKYLFKFRGSETHTCWVVHGPHPSSVAKGERSRNRIQSGIINTMVELYYR